MFKKSYKKINEKITVTEEQKRALLQKIDETKAREEQRRKHPARRCLCAAVGVLLLTGLAYWTYVRNGPEQSGTQTIQRSILQTMQNNNWKK